MLSPRHTHSSPPCTSHADARERLYILPWFTRLCGFHEAARSGQRASCPEQHSSGSTFLSPCSLYRECDVQHTAKMSRVVERSLLDCLVESLSPISSESLGSSIPSKLYILYSARFGVYILPWRLSSLTSCPALSLRLDSYARIALPVPVNGYTRRSLSRWLR